MKYNKGRKPCLENHKHSNVRPSSELLFFHRPYPNVTSDPSSHPDGQSLWQPLSPKLLLPQRTAAHEACDWSEMRRRHSTCQNTSKRNFAFRCGGWLGLVQTVRPILNFYHLESWRRDWMKWVFEVGPLMCFFMCLFNNLTYKEDVFGYWLFIFLCTCLVLWPSYLVEHKTF